MYSTADYFRQKCAMVLLGSVLQHKNMFTSGCEISILLLATVIIMC